MEKSLNYRQARAIRNSGLGDLISKNLMNDRGLGSSIGKAVSDKFKAKVTAVKEKFDPLNIAKKLTGNVGATLFGKITGRSKSDISHFTGITGSKSEDPLYTKISDGQNQSLRKGDALADVMARLYNLTKKYHEEDVQRLEVENNFKKIKQDEKEKWQNELLEAITGLSKNIKPTAAKEEPEEKTKGIFDYAKDFLESNLMRMVGAFFLGPVGGALIAVAVATYLLKKAVDLVPNASNLTPSEAAAALSGDADDIKKLGGREKLEEVIKTGKQKAQAIKDMPEGEEKIKAIRDYGGQKKIDEVLADTNTYKAPEYIDEGPDKVPPRPDTTGGKNQARAAAWDRKFGDKYDASGTKKSYSGPMRRLTSGVEPSNSGAGRGVAQMADYERSQTPNTAVFGKYPNMKPTVQPMPTVNPLAEKVQQVINQNNDLMLDESTAGKTIVIDNSKNINKTIPGKEIFSQPGSVPVRNEDDTIGMCMRKNYRPV